MNRECAIAVREQFTIQGKTDCVELARQLGLSVREVDSQGFDGALVRSASEMKGIIYVKQTMREQTRKRFTIAHEIGHFILHCGQSLSCGSTDIEAWKGDQSDPERQADEFASELLLPSVEVLNQIGSQWPSFQLVGAIADHFCVSLTATARKYCDVAPQDCAVVWSVDGIIRWMHPSSRFNHWIPVGEKLGVDSFAAGALAGKVIPQEMQEVAAEEWISSNWLVDNAVICEQTIPMPHYKGCLSLLWAKRQIENRPTEEDELLPELDPDGFTLRRKRWPR